MQAGGVCVGWQGGGVAGTRVVSSKCVSRHACGVCQHMCVRSGACASVCIYRHIYIHIYKNAFPSRCCTPVRLQHPFAAAFLSVCSLMSRHSRVN